MDDKRDPGKDRERDKDINTDISAEEADDIFTKDPWTTDDAVLDDDPGSHRPTRLGRKWITEAVRGVAGGMAGALNEELERRAPNLSVVKTELTDTWDDIKELREDLTKQLQPFTRSMENIARRILPRARRAMPESWYKKMEMSLQARADERAAAAGGSYSKEEEQASTIRSELEAVFAQQQEHTLEVDHRKELDEKKEQMIERGLAATRHKADMRIYTRIYDAVRGTELFHRTLHTAYMKKSLEVQYKHFFVAQDTYNLLSQSFSAFEEYMRGVVKNTGLPDAAKANASDYLKELRTQRYGMLMSEYLTNARKMIFGKIKSAASDALSGVSMASSMAEMAPDMLDAYQMEHGGTGGLASYIASWILGRTKGSGIVRAGLDKIAPWVTALNGSTANFKDRLYLGIDKLQRQWSNDTNPFKQFIAQFLPNVSGITGAPNDLLRDPEKPAVYDKATRQTIVEIIPGYLREIWHEVAMFRTGREDLPMMTYNRYRREFTSTDQFRKDMMGDQAMADSPETQAYRVNSFIQVIAKGATYKNPNAAKDGGANAHAKTISKIMANHAVYSMPLDPDRLLEYINSHTVDNYIEAISSGIDPGEFDATVRVILNGITNKDGSINPLLAKALGDTITEMRKADQFKVTLARNTEVFGDRPLISASAGEVWIDKDGNKHILRNKTTGIINDVTGSVEKEYLSNRLADIDESKLTKPEDIEKTWGSEELDSYLKAEEYVEQRVGAWKTAFEDSAPGKAMVWLAGKLGWFFDSENGSKLPSLARTLAGKAAESMAKPKETEAEKRINALAKRSAIRDKERAKESPDAVVNIVGAASAGAAPKIKETRAERRRRRRAEKEAAERAAAEVAKSAEEQTSTPAEPSQTKDEEGVILNVETPPTPETNESKLKKWFDSAVAHLDESLDKLPQSQEDVEKQVNEVIDKLDAAWRNRPKSAEDIKDRFEKYVQQLSEKHPDLAKYAVERANEIAQTRGFKFLSAWSKYLTGKLSPKATKWIKQGREFISREYADKKKKTTDKYYEIATDFLKKAGKDPQLAEIATIALNPFSKKEDAEAAKQIIAEADPKFWEDLRTHADKQVKQWASETYGTAKEKLRVASEATGGFLKDLTKKLGSGFASLRGSWYEGTGDEPAPERTTAAGVSSSLMSLLEEWRASQTRAHATLIEAAEHLINVVETRSFGKDEERGKDGRYVTIKEFNRDNYGFFGAGGKIVGGILKKTASTVGKGAWWLGKTMAKGYVHAAMLPFQIPYYTVKGVAKVGSWAANSIGINPFRDIYVVGEDKPILTWRKQASKEGVYFAGTKTRPKSSKEIIEKGLPIVDHEGQYLITEEDIKKGLWAKDSSMAKGVGAGLAGIIKAPFGVAKAYIGLEAEIVKGMFGIGKTIAKGIFGAGAPEKYVDVYRAGEFKKPILTRRKQKEGVFLRDKEGNFSRLERSADIHEPVYELIDGKPQEVISEEDIEHGLCDVNGKPLGSGQYRGGLLGAALGLGAGLGKFGLKVLGGGAGMFFSFWKNAFGLMGKAGGMALKGLGRLGARLFGFDTKDGHGSIAVKSITDRLDVIIDLIKDGVKTATVEKPEAPKETPVKEAVHGAAAAISSIAGLKKDKTGAGASAAGGAAGESKGDESTFSGKVATGAIGAATTWAVSKIPFIKKAKDVLAHPIDAYKAHRAAKAAGDILAKNGLSAKIIKSGATYYDPATGNVVAKEIGEAAEKGGKVLFKNGKAIVDATGKAVKSDELIKLGMKETSRVVKQAKAAEESAKLTTKAKKVIEGTKNVLSKAKKVTDKIPKGALSRTLKVGGKVAGTALAVIGPILEARDTDRILDAGVLILGIATKEEEAAILKKESGATLTPKEEEIIRKGRARLTQEQEDVLRSMSGRQNQDVLNLFVGRTNQDYLDDELMRREYLKEHGNESHKIYDAMRRWDLHKVITDNLKFSGDHSWYDPRFWWNGFAEGTGLLAQGAKDAAVFSADTVDTGLTVLDHYREDKRKREDEETKANWRMDALNRSMLESSSKATDLLRERGIILSKNYYASNDVKSTGAFRSMTTIAKGDVLTEKVGSLYRKYMKERHPEVDVEKVGSWMANEEFLKYLKESVTVEQMKTLKEPPGPSWTQVKSIKWYPNKLRTGAPYATVPLSDVVVKALRDDKDAKLLRNKDAWPTRGKTIENMQVSDSIDKMCFNMYLDGFEDVRQFYVVQKCDMAIDKSATRSTTEWTTTYTGGMVMAPQSTKTTKIAWADKTVFVQWFKQWIEILEGPTGFEGSGTTKSRKDRKRTIYEKSSLCNKVYKILSQYWQEVQNLVEESEKNAGKPQTFMDDAALESKIKQVYDEITKNSALDIKEYNDAIVLEDAVLEKLKEESEYKMASGEQLEALKRRHAVAVNKVLSNMEGSQLQKTYEGATPETPEPKEETSKPDVPDTNSISGVESLGIKKYKAAQLRRYQTCVEDYINSIGGVGKVKEMSYSQFRNGLREYAEKNHPANLNDSMIDHFVSQSVNEGDQYYKSCIGATKSSYNIRNGELVDRSTGEVVRGVDSSYTVKPAPDTKTVTPAKVEEAKVEAAAAQHAATAKAITTAVGPTVENARALEEQKAIANGVSNMTNLQSKSIDLLGSIIGPNGLRVEGIPELTAITAAKPAGGNVTHVTNIMPTRTQEEGLNVRAGVRSGRTYDF